MISSIQLRMARAALKLTARQLGTSLGLSAMSVSRYERGDRSVISVGTAERMMQWFTERHIFFGPGDSVCIKQNIFAQERWCTLACYQLLKEHGILPTSAELIAAYNRIVGDKHEAQQVSTTRPQDGVH